MRSSILLALSAAIGLTVAQSGNLPNCAFACIGQLPASCNGDFTCICTDKSFLANVSCCIHNSCSESDQTAALNYAKSICGPAASTLPTSASCAAGASGSPTGSSSSGSGSSSMSMTGSATSSTMSGSSTSSSMSMTMTSSGASGTSSAASTSSSASASGNIGHKYAADSVGIIGALVGAVALL